jgi:hypothetical protein
VAWETDQELETAWLGGYGPEEEAEAEEFLDECLEGEHGEDVQAAAESMEGNIEAYIDEGGPVRDDLAAELQEQEVDDGTDPDVDPAELSAAEQRVIAAEQEDHFTSLLAAELERFADQVKGRALTPGEIDEVAALVPTDAIEGGGAFPDLVGQHGKELKERWSTREHRLQASAEVIRDLPGDHIRGPSEPQQPAAAEPDSADEGDDGDDKGDRPMDRSERVAAGAQAIAALQGDEGE